LRDMAASGDLWMDGKVGLTHSGRAT
jgi:hypothetical protein